MPRGHASPKHLSSIVPAVGVVMEGCSVWSAKLDSSFIYANLNLVIMSASFEQDQYEIRPSKSLDVYALEFEAS